MSGKKRKTKTNFSKKEDTSEEKEISIVNVLTNYSEVDKRSSIEESSAERHLGVRMIKNKAYFLV